MRSQLSQWRTVLAVLALGNMLLVALLICATMPPAFGQEMFATAAWAIIGLAVAIAGKSTAQHLAGGGGVKGAVSALLTPAKPETPAEP